MAELKVTLYIFWAVYRKRGYPRFITYRELLNDASLLSAIKETERSPEESLRQALNTAAERGTILYLSLANKGVPEDIYFLNTESDRQAVARIQSGEIVLDRLEIAARPAGTVAELPDIFTLYEQNIGMLTPMIAEELRAAEKLYPTEWLKEAVKEAVALNKRNWRYIARILERWATEGKGDGTYRRDSKTDPDKYIKGPYGHMVRR
jgi:DnaD/phage-associated family protein